MYSKLRLMPLFALAFMCLTGSQPVNAARTDTLHADFHIGGNVVNFAKKALLFSAPFLVRTFNEKRNIVHNKYAKDLMIGVIAAYCWPKALHY